MGSISRHARIHFTRPGVDAALQVIDAFVPSSREEIRYVLAAMTVMTNDDDLAIDRQIVRTCCNLAHGNVPGPWEHTDLYFPGFTHVEHQRLPGALIVPIS